MKSIKDAAETIMSAIDNYDKFELKDKGIFLAAFADFAELCDEIMAEYDHRNARMDELLERLQ